MESKYIEIFHEMEKDIKAGKFRDTRKLLTEDEYIQLYNVSRNTVRRAIDMLIRKGYCYPVQGKGIFLRKHLMDGCINLENIGGLTHDFAPRDVSTNLISFIEIPADEDLADKLEVPIGTILYYIERLRLIDKKPYSLERMYYRKDLIRLTENIVSTSILSYFRTQPGMKMTFNDYVLRAVKITKYEADLLGLKEGDPGFRTENFGMNRKGEIAYFNRGTYHYQEARFLKMASYL